MENSILSLNELKQIVVELKTRLTDFKQLSDYESKQDRIKQIDLELGDEKVWSNVSYLQKLHKEKKILDNQVGKLVNFQNNLVDIDDLLNSEFTIKTQYDTQDPQKLTDNKSQVNQQLYDNQQNDAIAMLQDEVLQLKKIANELEFCLVFSNPMDSNNCFVDIQSGSGGVEAQDWAEMLLRMYTRYANNKSFKVDIIEKQLGDTAGIKSATIKIFGDYAFGYLRTETGVHRLVRNSPFDANHKRHTSFASVFVYPEVDDNIEIDINPSDLRIDTFKSSGAGGQHVNTTDSAVRITHIPSGLVVQSQGDRSQHRNRDECMKMMRAKLYDLEMQKQQKEKQKLEDGKTTIGWGYQIRSYVLDQSRIKDLRTNIEIGNVKSVLDGELDEFIRASLLAGY